MANATRLPEMYITNAHIHALVRDARLFLASSYDEEGKRDLSVNAD